MEMTLNPPMSLFCSSAPRQITLPERAFATTSAPPTDYDLLNRILQREEYALGVVYDRYNRLVYTIALRITGDVATAEETVQDVFQAVWQSAAGFQAQHSFVGWLIGITRHRAIDATRSRRYRARKWELTYDDSLMIDAAQDQQDELLLRETVRTALATLTPEQRHMIELAYYGGLTHAQIAACTGEPIGTVKSRIRVGLVRLRDLLYPQLLEQ